MSQGRLRKVSGNSLGADTMPTRNTQSARLQKLQQQMQAEVKRKMDEAAANEEETLGSKRRRRSGKPKGATHGRDNAPQRTTFGSEEMFDTRGLSTSQIRSLQPGDNPQRDGVGDCFAHNAPPKEGGIDLARGKGKNGLAEESDSEDEPEDGTGGKGRWELEDQPSPNAGLRRFSQQESCQEDRLPHPGRSPFREPSNVHRVAADVLALKSRSGSGARSGQGSGVVHQELALRGRYF